MYKLVKNSSGVMLGNAFIPADIDNTDYAEYLKWLEEGNNPQPVDVASREAIIADVWKAIKAERDRREASGVKVGTKWFHSDGDSKIKQLGLVLLGANIPSNLQWKTMDGSFVTMTQTLAQQVFAASAASAQAVFAAAETHRASMEQSEDPSSYDYSTGWPAIYGE